MESAVLSFTHFKSFYSVLQQSAHNNNNNNNNNNTFSTISDPQTVCVI